MQDFCHSSVCPLICAYHSTGLPQSHTNIHHHSISIVHNLLILDLVRIDQPRHSCSPRRFLCSFFLSEKFAVIRTSKFFRLHTHFPCPDADGGTGSRLKRAGRGASTTNSLGIGEAWDCEASQDKQNMRTCQRYAYVCMLNVCMSHGSFRYSRRCEAQLGQHPPMHWLLDVSTAHDTASNYAFSMLLRTHNNYWGSPGIQNASRQKQIVQSLLPFWLLT